MTEPFKFSDGQLAYTAEELFSFCQESPAKSLEYLMREDFEKWLDYIGKSDLAAKARQIRQASLSDSDRIKQFITQCQSISVPTQKSSPTTITPDTSKSEAAVASTATTAPKASTATTAPKAPTATTAPKASTATTAPKASTATTAPKAPTATTAPKASTATTTPKASTATKKTNPLASLLQKLFGKK